jgi:hypothetical protein
MDVEVYLQAESLTAIGAACRVSKLSATLDDCRLPLQQQPGTTACQPHSIAYGTQAGSHWRVCKTDTPRQIPPTHLTLPGRASPSLGLPCPCDSRGCAPLSTLRGVLAALPLGVLSTDRLVDDPRGPQRCCCCSSSTPASLQGEEDCMRDNLQVMHCQLQN